MLLWLAEYLAETMPNTFHDLQVFNYITLRAILATMTALIISFVVGPKMIRKLADYKVGQVVRRDGPQTHLIKAGTPTMGGALILVAISVATLLWGDLSNRYIWVVLLTTLGFGAVGWVDDWRKIVKDNSDGLLPKEKYFWQSVVGLSAAVYLQMSAPSAAETSFILPVLKDVVVPLSAGAFIVLAYVVIVGSSNAVNLTDGLDGLAILPTVMVAGALAIFAYLSGRVDYSEYLGIPYIQGAGEVAIFCACIVGSGLGFLWFNAYPAEVFMGDVGALALGAALGVVAVIVRQEIILFIMGGVFVVETVSVAAQVGYFKYTKNKTGEGKRILLMAPLHHHYEKKGWKETQVVVRFWIITMMLVLVGLATLKIR